MNERMKKAKIFESSIAFFTIMVGVAFLFRRSQNKWKHAKRPCFRTFRELYEDNVVVGGLGGIM